MSNIKAKILKVGTFNEQGQVVGWEFDCENGAWGITINPDTGEVLYAGYTLAELRKIYEQTSCGS